MSEDNLDKFLDNATKARELSAQEKKEAMMVARDVWKKSQEILGGKKDTAILKKEEPLSRKYITVSTAWDANSQIGEKVREMGGNADLVVGVITEGRDKKEEPMKPTDTETYYFFPDRVIKESKSVELPTEDNLDYISSLDALRGQRAMGRYQGVLNQRRTTKASRPDKVELQSLLDLVSSARESSSLVGIVPRPK